MNAAHFMAKAAGLLACRHDFASGYRYDSLGRKITGCDECAGCDSNARRDQLGITGFAEIISEIGKLKLRWPCPGCGFPVIEYTTPLTAISDSKAVSEDPLCAACRNASA